MKKLFFKTGILFFGLSLLTLSCSEDNIKPEKNSQQLMNRYLLSEMTEAKELFIKMILTEEYKDYKYALDSFVYKMENNAVLFKSKEEAMIWISENLSKTSFNSIEEFESKLNIILSKHSNLIIKNQLLFTLLDKADKSEFLEIVQPSLAQVPNITNANGCQNGCMDDCSFDLNANNYVHSLNFYGSNSPAFGEMYYWIRVKEIIADFNGCMSSC